VIISVVPIANIGNRMLSYMAVQAVVQRLSMPVTVNAGLPEWGMKFDRELHRRLEVTPLNVMYFDDADGTTLDEMVARIEAANPPAVIFEGFYQRFPLLRDKEFYQDIFPPQPLDIEPFADDELVINIRAGDLLGGHWSWYPLVPPLFYYHLLQRTGLRPVLLGQLEDSVYMRDILHLCPGARLLPSAGPMVDFNRLRHAKHLSIPPSTFSWLAAWLSEATTIHYPLLGFMHPFCITRGWNNGGGVDLTPLGDPRYLYHLFPILNAAPELDYLRHIAQFNPLSVPVPADFAAGLSAKALHIEGDVDNLAGRASWYLRRYPEAAWSIAFGHYSTAQEHFEQLGRPHGFERNRMQKLDWRLARVNLALGEPALQSSVSQWSLHPTLAADAAGAVSGEVEDKASFHTALEDAPWWRVDLGNTCNITEIWLFNRIESYDLAMRAARLAVDTGTSEDEYTEVARYEADTPFGGADGTPLTLRFPTPITARFVRIRLLHRNFLHLNQIEVYGEVSFIVISIKSGTLLFLPATFPRTVAIA
jgi:hypothetical protein